MRGFHGQCMVARALLDGSAPHTTVRPVRRSLLVLLALVAAACAPGEKSPTLMGAFQNTPEVLPLNVPAGEKVLLRHTNGTEYTLASEAGGVRTPVLWDGAWEVVSGGQRSQFTVGTPAATADSFDACRAAAVDDSVRAEVLACVQSSAMRRGERAYADAHKELDAMLAALEKATPNGPANWYCFMGGEMIAAAAVLNGADASVMLRDFTSHCSFSLIHGVYMAKVAPGLDLRSVCEYQEGFGLQEVDHVSQCWNGIGIGLARIHRFDAGKIFQACAEAPEVGALKNCFEGALNFFYNYQFRLSPGDWYPPSIDARWCASQEEALLGSEEFQEVCYRVAVRGLLEETLDPMAPAKRFAETCRALAGPAREGCMVAAGSLSARLIIDYRRSLDLASEAVEVCGVTTGVYDEPCLVRLFSGLLATPQSPYGFSAEDLLVHAPKAHRQVLSEHFARWSKAILGVGSALSGAVEE